MESVHTITCYFTSHTHTQVYNTPPHSMGSEGHIPPPQSASGFHTLLQGCECECGLLSVCCVTLRYFSDLLGVWFEGKEGRSEEKNSLKPRITPKSWKSKMKVIYWSKTVFLLP